MQTRLLDRPRFLLAARSSAMPPKGPQFFFKDVEGMLRDGGTEELVRGDLLARGCPMSRVSQLISDARRAGLLLENVPKSVGDRRAAPAPAVVEHGNVEVGGNRKGDWLEGSAETRGPRILGRSSWAGVMPRSSCVAVVCTDETDGQ